MKKLPLGLMLLFLTSCEGFNVSSIQNAGDPTDVTSSGIRIEDGFAVEGDVKSMLTVGNSLYIGGDFSYVGYESGTGVQLKTTSCNDHACLAVNLQNVPKINGWIQAVVDDGSGGFYVGGYFTHVGSTSRARLAHILSDGSLDTSFNMAMPHGWVNALARSGTDLYVGGNFNTIGGVARYSLAKINITTGVVDVSFTEANSGADVKGFSILNDDLYVTGVSSISGSPVPGIAKLNRHTGVLDTAFVGASGGNGVLAYGNDVYVYGSGISKLDATTGALDTGFVPDVLYAPGSAGSVFSVQIKDNDLYLGGWFNTVGGVSRKNIAKVNRLTGALDPTFNQGTADWQYLKAMVLSGDDLFIGGKFTEVGGVSRSRLAKLNAVTGALDTNYNVGVGNDVYAMALSGSKIYVGGYFNTVAGKVRNYMAKFDLAAGAIDDSFNPNPNNHVLAIAHSEELESVYAGGYFTSIGGGSRNYFAKLSDSTGAVDPGFDLLLNNTTFTIAVSEDQADVYLGGTFSTSNGAGVNSVLKVNAETGALDSGFNVAATNKQVNKILLNGNNLYIGGWFTNMGGLAQTHLVKVNRLTGAGDAAFVGSPNNEVMSMAFSDDKSSLYAGGWFTQVNGTTRNRMAKVNSTTGVVDPTFNPNMDYTVNAVAVSGNDVYAGGFFTNVGGLARNYVAKLDGATGAADASFNASIDFDVYVLEIYQGNPLVSGEMDPFNLYRGNPILLNSSSGQQL